MSSHSNCFEIKNYDRKWKEGWTTTINMAGRDWLVIVKRNRYNIRKRKNVEGASENGGRVHVDDTSETPVVATSGSSGDETASILPHIDGHEDKVQPSKYDYLSFHIVNNGIDSVLANISLVVYNNVYEGRNEYLSSYTLLEVQSNCAFGCSHFIPHVVLIDPSTGFLDSINSIKLGVTVELFLAEQPTYTVLSLSQALNYLKNINIMVVEDSHFQRKIMCKSLNTANSWVVSSVTSPLEVLDLLQSTGDDSRDLRKIDVFVIDYNLDVSGGMNGAELTLKLRENNINAVIIGCSNSIEKYASKFIAAGANSAWPKPFPCAAEMAEYLYSALAFRKSTVTDDARGDPLPVSFSILDGLQRNSKGGKRPIIVNPGFHDADCILVAKLGQRIPAHRLTLAACSGWFANVFLESDKEVTEVLEELPLDDDTHILQELVRFSYTTTIRESAVKSYSNALLQAAVKYQFNSLITILTDVSS